MPIEQVSAKRDVFETIAARMRLEGDVAPVEILETPVAVGDLDVSGDSRVFQRAGQGELDDGLAVYFEIGSELSQALERQTGVDRDIHLIDLVEGKPAVQGGASDGALESEPSDGEPLEIALDDERSARGGAGSRRHRELLEARLVTELSKLVELRVDRRAPDRAKAPGRQDREIGRAGELVPGNDSEVGLEVDRKRCLEREGAY